MCGSAQAATLAMGGSWHDLGGALAEETFEPVALQPLANVIDAAERSWSAEWVAAILSRENVAVTPEVKEHIWSALSSLASAPVHERTLTGLSVLLQSNSLKRALKPYCLGGPHGRLLDSEVEHLGDADVQCFETEGLIGSSAAPAVLSYLFHRIEAGLDGSPTLLIIDEGCRPEIFCAPAASPRSGSTPDVPSSTPSPGFSAMSPSSRTSSRSSC
jgi:type IV secretory pathway VirB4 component